ncbi:MAG TPA: M4 family metallopeptidase [Saprospiraceae bacterium]|nr:M4 family metallopeptidase [Saprospiraceae bacterium]
MRFFIVFIFCSGMLTGQVPFKSIPFTSRTEKNQVLQPMKKLPLPVSRHKQAPPAWNEFRPLKFTPGKTAARPTAIDYIHKDHHSFWANSSKKTGFNQRNAQSSVSAFLEPLKEAMKIKTVDQEFQIVSRETDEVNMQHIRVRQVYQNIPVYGGELVIHGFKDQLSQVNGTVYPTPLSLNTHPRIQAAAALDIVKKDLEAEGRLHAVSDQLLAILNRPLSTAVLTIFHDSADRPHLTYEISYVANGLEIWKYIVDAEQGQIFKKYKNTCSLLPHDHCKGHPEAGLNPVTDTNTGNPSFEFAGKTSTPAMDLNGSLLSLNTYEEGGRYYLLDASRSMFKSIGTDTEEPSGVIWTFDGKNNSPSNPNFSANLINGSTNTGWISPTAASAHNNAGLAYQYFLSKNNRLSINGQGGNIVSMINITEEDGSQMDNAFWNGEAMFYGSGDQAFSNLAKGLDVAGHEMSHGVIQSTANLDYEGESGALNESFADIFGRLIDRDDWLIGESVVKLSAFPSGALRSLSDPHNGGLQFGDPGYQPRVYGERFTESADNGGVHINSGIPNWAFYQFTIRINNDLDKAEKIYYRALTLYLTRSSRFVDCRRAVIQAATDLYGASGAEVNAAKAAYDLVGILDGAPTPTEQNAETNPGEDFIVYADVNSTALYLADPAGNLVANPLSSKDPRPESRTSVTDDGSAFVFVGQDKKIHYVIVDWNISQITDEGILQDQPLWRNVAISRDGNRIAALQDQEENRIHIYDFGLGSGGEWRTFDLYNPTYTSGITTGEVLYADAIEFDFSGEWLMYDAYNSIPNTDWADINYWDISFLRVYDQTTQDWGDGRIVKLFSQLPEQTSVGNPTFSKNSPYIIAFDMRVEDTDPFTYLLLGANLETGRLDTIFINSELAWPSYSTLDDKVIFNASTQSGTEVIGQISVNNSKIEGTGTATALISNARQGNWFANGARDLSTPFKDQSLQAYAVRLSPNPVSRDKIRVGWTQPKPSEGNRFAIYDVMGRLKWSSTGHFAGGDQTLDIPIHSLSAGIYSLTLTIEGHTGSLKFIRL